MPLSAAPEGRNGTEGWAMFIHQPPYGSFDLSGAEGRFTPNQNSLLPLDLFVAEGDPAAIMAEYARITMRALSARASFKFHFS